MRHFIICVPAETTAGALIFRPGWHRDRAAETGNEPLSGQLLARPLEGEDGPVGHEDIDIGTGASLVPRRRNLCGPLGVSHGPALGGLLF